MSVPPEMLHIVHQWVERAEDDFVAARHLLTLDEKAPLTAVCFHAQQCIEKYLKALLSFLAIPFPKTHDLSNLLARIPGHVDMEVEPVEIASLNRYSVEGRYPGDWEPITREEAEEAVETLRKNREVIRLKLPEDALTEEESAGGTQLCRVSRPQGPGIYTATQFEESLG